MLVNDSHCHFFSENFFRTLTRPLPDLGGEEAPVRVTAHLGWEAPGTDRELARRWCRELDAHSVGRAALIASVPGDEGSVLEAVRRHPSRFVGFFMVDARAEDALGRVRRGLEDGLKGVCLFPAMHRYSLGDERVDEVFAAADATPGSAVFVHCGVLSVGVRKKLGLPSRFDIRMGNPLDLHPLALKYPELPVLIPHFGAGFFREALMLADLCPNVRFDTSSSNRWVRYLPGLSLAGAFEQALEVAGPERLIFGSDSSFFPRGWNQEVFQAQRKVLQDIGLGGPETDLIFRKNFDRLFPV